MQILIIKMSSLGDILQAFPVVSYLKNQFPEVRLDWAVEKRLASLVKAHPQIDHVQEIDTKKLGKEIIGFTLNLREKEYDVVFDLQGNCKSGLICLLSKAKVKVGFCRKGIAEWPNLLATTKKISLESDLPIRERYLTLVQGYFKDQRPFSSLAPLLQHQERISNSTFNQVKGRILVAPFSRWENKAIPISMLTDLLSDWEKKGYRFCLIYQGKEEQRIAEGIAKDLEDLSLLGNRSLPELQHIAKSALGAICVDSALLHLFALTSLPLFSLFGPSSSLTYGPRGISQKNFQGECSYGQTFKKRCSFLRTCPDAPCMRKISRTILNLEVGKWLSNLRG